MKIINASDVNEAYKIAIDDALSADNGVRWRRITSRLGEEVMEYREPVATVYKYPRNRVLFNETRDANPFFHVMEALWILAGRNDVAWIGQFNEKIKDYSDNGRTFYGAYGHRLVNHCKFEQINQAIRLLISEPDTRRCVLSIWSPEDLNSTSKDVPCNTHVYLKVREGKLHMTVCCRSNDVIWGAYGANVVHFSILMEYIAANVDVGMGTYTHISDSFHIYRDNPSFLKHEKLGPRSVNARLYGRGIDDSMVTPLIENTILFDMELHAFFTNSWRGYYFQEPFFVKVALPLRKAWELYKEKDMFGAVNYTSQIQSADWRLASMRWLQRRKKNVFK